jgi:hypothetical protein
MPTYPVVAIGDGDVVSPEWTEAITDAVNDLDERVGFVGESFGTASTSSTGTEAFHISTTFTATSGTRYRVEFDGPAQGNNAGTLGEFRLRYAAGASVTSAGTEIRVTALHAMVANQNFQVALAGTFSPAAGQVTVGVSVRWNAGGTTSSLNCSPALAVGRVGVYRVG